GSFAFLVTVDEPVIRDFPTHGAIGEPLYHHGSGDGPKLPDQALSYRSRLPAAQLLALSQEHIRASGYAPHPTPGAPGLVFVSGTNVLHLRIAPADDDHAQ